MNDLSWALGASLLPSGLPDPGLAPPSVLVVGRQGFHEQMSAILRDGHLAERWAHNEVAARAALSRIPVCLVVLDGGLATPSDFSFCARLTAHAACPVIVVTAGDEEEDRILALGSGADDCVPASCGPRELLARIQVRLRRSHQGRRAVEYDRGTTATFGEWRLDLVRRQILCPDGRWVRLGGAELMTMECLSRNGGRLTPAGEIIQSAPRTGKELTENHLRVQISRLRNKLGRDSSGRMAIFNVRNKGYVLAGD